MRKEDLKDYNKTISEMMECVGDMPQDEKMSLCDKALELIGDYPLYACSSNISAEEAILIGLVLYGDIEQAYNDLRGES